MTDQPIPLVFFCKYVGLLPVTFGHDYDECIWNYCYVIISVVTDARSRSITATSKLGYICIGRFHKYPWLHAKVAD